MALIDEEYGKAALIIFAIILIIGLYKIEYVDKAESINKGEHYTTQCQLIETNIDNGLFQPNTNKLNCGDVIENVSVDEYQEAIKAYKK